MLLRTEDPDSLLLNPPSPRAQYMIEIMQVLGFCKSGGFGIQPLGLVEINQWVSAYGSKLTIWEIETLVELSKVYVEKYQEFNEKPVAAPYASSEEVRSDISSRLKASLVRRSKANRTHPPLRLRSENNEQ